MHLQPALSFLLFTLGSVLIYMLHMCAMAYML